MKTTSSILVSMFLGFSACATFAETKAYDVRELGAKGDGKTLDTAAIQKALDDCGKAGGGIVRLSVGTYLSQPLSLRSKTTLQLDEGAKLLASDDPKDFLPPGVVWPGAQNKDFTAFVNGKDLTDVAITGKGVIDGAGERWWGPAREAKNNPTNTGYTLPRPRLVRFIGCKNVTVKGVTLQNSPTFHLVPENCEDVLIEGVTITAPDEGPNTDAIDPSISRRVTITKCVIDVGDDNVAIKSGKKMPGREFACEDLTITDCVFKRGHGLSIGSETPGGVRNLTVKNCTFDGTENGIRIKSPRGRGGTVENLVYENITMKDVEGALVITCYYPKIPQTDTAQPVTDGTPKFKNISIRNLKATSTKGAGVIIGLPESLVENVVLENVQIEAATTGLNIRNAKGIQLKNVKITSKEGPPFIVEEAQVEGLPETTAK